MSQPPYGYAAMPSDSGPPATGRPPRPTTVRAAVWLLLVTMAFGVIGALFAFNSQDDIKRELVKRNSSLSSDEIDRLAHLGLVIGVIVGILFSVLYLWLAWKVWAGRNWARITLWVFLALGVLGGITTFVQPDTGVRHALAALGGLIDATIIVLLALPASNRFFAKPRPSYYYPPGYTR